MKSIFFSAITIAGKSIGAILLHKRCMFGINNVRNLKKSGDLIIAGKTNAVKIVSNTTAASKLKSLDLANKHYVESSQILNTNITTTVAIKNIVSGVIYPIKVSRFLAIYGRIDKGYPIEGKDRMLKLSFLRFKDARIEEAEIAHQQEKMSKNQFFVFIKRMEALNLSYQHSTITDIIEEDEEYITIIYHVITTKATIVDYGGANKYKPIFLYYDDVKNKSFYSIPLTYVHKLRKTDYFNYFVLKNEESFKIDGIDLQRKLAKSLSKIIELNKFKSLNVNKNCLDLLPSNIDPDEIFPDSEYNDFITSGINNLDTII